MSRSASPGIRTDRGGRIISIRRERSVSPIRTITYNQMNIIAFHSKLNEFWAAEKYCDVIIEVEGKPFNCHRLALSIACEYFDKMFGGNFRESKQENVVLQEPDVNSNAFEEILRYVYTGDVALTKDNVYCVLRASVFFNLPRIETRCIHYIRCNLPITGMFETFTFACLSEKKSLMSSVARYLMKHFHEYWNDDKFVELSFEGLQVLLSQNWYLPSQIERCLVSAIIKWVNYSRELRGGYLEELIDAINPQFISGAECMKLMSNNGNISRAQSTKYPVGNHELGLHVYMACGNIDRSIRVFSASKGHPRWTMTCKMKELNLKSVALENYLYCLSNFDSKQTSFCICSTLDVSAESSTTHVMLKPPPAASCFFDLSNIQNRIYVNNYYGIKSEFTKNASNSVFSKEEVSQGIYVYNIEVDKWFPTPILTSKLSRTTMVACDNLLYLFGGTMNSSSPASQDSSRVQVLDSRTSKWQDLGIKNEEQRLCNSHTNCCAHEGKVYLMSPNGVTVFDPVAAKWAEVQGQPAELSPTSHLVSHQNWLWIFGAKSVSNFFSVETYNTSTQTWSTSPISGTLSVTDDGQQSLGIRDIVVFKT